MRAAKMLMVLLIALSLTAPASAKTFAKITVEAGRHTRINTPVSVELKDIDVDTFGLWEIQGAKRNPIPFQIEPSEPPKMWWIIDGLLEPGRKKVYEITEDMVKWKLPVVLVQQTDKWLDVQHFGKKVLRYNNALVAPPPDANSLNVRSGFIHPVWSPAGHVLTDIHPPDHYHHFGIWMPWTKTVFEGREVDFWNLYKGQGTVRFVKFISTVNGVIFGQFVAEHEHVAFKTADGQKVVLNENWDVRVYNVGGPEKKYWLWDLISTQRCATDSPLSLPKHRYGGLGFRGRRDWKDDDDNYSTSEGKTRKDGHATRARWADMSGPIDAGRAGVTIFSHPANFRHPEPVRIWPKGNVFFCYAPSQLGDWSIEPGRDYVFRYRFYVHDGRMDVNEAERLWNDFAEPPKVTLERTE